nr:hypothetical protein CFP56_42746 [Quercus suber]
MKHTAALITTTRCMLDSRLQQLISKASQVYENSGGLAAKQTSSQRRLLGHDEQHCASLPYNLDSPKQYGIWLKASGNLKEISKRSRASSSRSQDDDRRGKSGDGSSEKSVLVIASPADLEFDHRVNLKFQNSRQNGQDVVLEKWGKTEGPSTKAKKNLENSYGVESTDSRAQLSNPSREQHYEKDSSKGPSEAYSLVGFLNSSAHEAYEITSPLKANVEIPNPSMKPVTLVSPKNGAQPREKANWKRNAHEKGKQTQTTPTRAHVKLSGSKRPNWLDFSEETEESVDDSSEVKGIDLGTFGQPIGPPPGFSGNDDEHNNFYDIDDL